MEAIIKKRKLAQKESKETSNQASVSTKQDSEKLERFSKALAKRRPQLSKEGASQSPCKDASPKYSPLLEELALFGVEVKGEALLSDRCLDGLLFADGGLGATESVRQMASELRAKPALDAGDSHNPSETVMAFIRQMVILWESAVAETGTVFDKRGCREARRNLVPLMRQFRTPTSPAADSADSAEVVTPVSDVHMKILGIVKACCAREYIKANGIYLDLAIGDSPWPMGVTMVGIHERVGRSKIATSAIAHILDDEVTRKYFQTLKQLISLCQSYFPTATPPRMAAVQTPVDARQ